MQESKSHINLPQSSFEAVGFPLPSLWFCFINLVMDCMRLDGFVEFVLETLFCREEEDMATGAVP